MKTIRELLEQERKAYIAGDVELAKLLGRLIDAEEELEEDELEWWEHGND